MGILKTVIGTGAIATLLLAITAGVLWHKLSLKRDPPILPVEYWGPGQMKADNPAVVPFKINISDDILSDLKYRLKSLPPLTPPLEDASFRYGFNTDALQKIVDFWLKEYNWREREIYLNKFPQFKTQISGLNIHFIHVKPSKVPAGVKILPIILVHGWPGSVREFYETIPMLTTPRPNEKFVFEVVVPSLPGFGFSDRASKQGLGCAKIAVILKSLMDRLGFKQFYVQGGDWGSVVGADMAVLYPESVLGYHSNLCTVMDPLSFLKMAAINIYPRPFLTSDVEASRFRSLTGELEFIIEESGYFHIQATKPDTIGVALTSSPAGLAAYLLEKFSTGSNAQFRSLPDGGLTKKFTLTNLLDNVMIYWVTGSVTSSLRLYKDIMNNDIALGLSRLQLLVPSACARFPNEMFYMMEYILRSRYVNLVHISDQPRGGHFAALEEPQLLSDDIWIAVDKMIKFHEKNI